jgi:hypothetical protein
MRSITTPPLAWAAGLLAASCAFSAAALPVTVTNAGYWLETVGSNSIAIAGGGSPTGVLTTLFVANTSPGFTDGTTASATLGGLATNPPAPDGLVPALWARRANALQLGQLLPLIVTFSNGGDSAVFAGRDLSTVRAMPLVSNLAIDASMDPLRPTVNWTLPTDPTLDIDRVQLVFYNDVTNGEIGSRFTTMAAATSFTFANPLLAGIDLVVNVRLIDLADDGLAFTAYNILAQSRAYVQYSVPAIPEPASFWLLAVGGLALAGRCRGKAWLHRTVEP